MKADTQMIKSLSDWRNLDQDSLIDLKEGVDRYPFCQTLQILYLLNLRKLNDSLFDVRLPHTAIHVVDRAHLKHQVQRIEQLLNRQATILTTSSELALTRKGAKTISDFLRETLAQPTKPSETPQEKVQEAPILPRKDEPEAPALPQHSREVNAEADQQFVNELHRETLAKVNQRLMELRGITPETTTESKGKRKPAKINPSPTVPNTSREEIINRFLETNPTISKVGSLDEKQMTIWQSKMKESLREDFVFVSETLANMYLEQGAVDKAIAVFEKLSLNYPEKSRYFAKLISQAKKNQNTLKSKK